MSPMLPFLRLSIQMPDWLTFILIPLGYLAVMRWVLPRLGVPT